MDIGKMRVIIASSEESTVYNLKALSRAPARFP